MTPEAFFALSDQDRSIAFQKFGIRYGDVDELLFAAIVNAFVEQNPRCGPADRISICDIGTIGPANGICVHVNKGEKLRVPKQFMGMIVKRKNLY